MFMTGFFTANNWDYSAYATTRNLEVNCFNNLWRI